MRTFLKRGGFIVAAAVALLLLAGSTSLANTIDVSEAVITPDSGDFLWEYTATLLGNSQIGGTVPSFFTIYDFRGLIAEESSPPDWTFSSFNVGPTAFSQMPSDNAGIPNLTWTYTGPLVQSTNASPVVLGQFVVRGSIGTSIPGEFTAQDQRTGGGVQGNIGPTTVPTPEPTTLALLFAGAPLGLVWAARRRKAKLV